MRLNIKKSGKLAEPVKTVIIVILILNGAFLASRTGLFDDLFSFGSLFGGAKSAEKKGGSEALSGRQSQAALPLAAAVKGSSGLRYGVKYDEAGIAEVYGKLRTVLGEALGSALAPKTIDAPAWRAALSGQNAYFDYEADIPLEVLAKWLGTELLSGFEGRARRIIITGAGDGKALLYYMDGEGRAWRCQTMADWLEIGTLLDTYLPNRAQFAFEKSSLLASDPYQLILGALPSLYKVSAEGSPFDGAAAEAASRVLGIGMHGDSSYTEADGTMVYLESGGYMKLRADGYISYSASDGQGLAEASGNAEMVECAISILEKIHASFAGDEKLYFSGLSEEGNIRRLSFRYVVQGVEVELYGGEAASAVFESGRLTQLKIMIRSYRLTEEAAGVLPEYQAAAAAGSLSEGAEARLVFPDGGGETALISPVWIAK
jgi:hypothetical protein